MGDEQADSGRDRGVELVCGARGRQLIGTRVTNQNQALFFVIVVVVGFFLKNS